jgi:alkylhydroperoxidase family enzyme
MAYPICHVGYRGKGSEATSEGLRKAWRRQKINTFTPCESMIPGKPPAKKAYPWSIDECSLIPTGIHWRQYPGGSEAEVATLNYKLGYAPWSEPPLKRRNVREAAARYLARNGASTSFIIQGRTSKMARLPYLEAEQIAPEYRDLLKRNTNLHKLLVNSPDMARAFSGIGGYIRFKSKLDPRLRELAILQVGWMEKSEYEFTHHVKIGKEFGVTDEDIEGLMAETEGKPSRLDPLARAILKGAREMVRGLAMSDSTFAEIKKQLSDEQMTDLVLTIAFYCAVVRVLATMKIDNEPYYKEVLQQYPIPGVN